MPTITRVNEGFLGSGSWLLVVDEPNQLRFQRAERHLTIFDRARLNCAVEITNTGGSREQLVFGWCHFGGHTKGFISRVCIVRLLQGLPLEAATKILGTVLGRIAGRSHFTTTMRVEIARQNDALLNPAMRNCNRLN